MVNKSRAMASSATVASDGSPTCVQSFGSPAEPGSNGDGWTEDNIDSNSVRVLEPTFTVVKVPSRVQQESPPGNMKEQREPACDDEPFGTEDSSENHEVELKDYDNGEGRASGTPSSWAVKKFISRVKIDRMKILRLKNFVLSRQNHANEVAVKDVEVSVSDESVEVAKTVELDHREQSCANRTPSVDELQVSTDEDNSISSADGFEAAGASVFMTEAGVECGSSPYLRTSFFEECNESGVQNDAVRRDKNAKGPSDLVVEENVEPSRSKADSLPEMCNSAKQHTDEAAENDATRQRGMKEKLLSKVPKPSRECSAEKLPESSRDASIEQVELEESYHREGVQIVLKRNRSELDTKSTLQQSDSCIHDGAAVSPRSEKGAKKLGNKLPLHQRIQLYRELRNHNGSNAGRASPSSKEFVLTRHQSKLSDLSCDIPSIRTPDDASSSLVLVQYDMHSWAPDAEKEEQASECDKLQSVLESVPVSSTPAPQTLVAPRHSVCAEVAPATVTHQDDVLVTPRSEDGSIYSAASTQAAATPILDATESISDAPSMAALDSRATPMTEETRTTTQFSSSLDSAFNINHLKWTANHHQERITAQSMLGGLLKCDPSAVVSTEQEDEIARCCASYLDEEYSITDTDDEQTLATSLESMSFQQYRKERERVRVGRR